MGFIGECPTEKKKTQKKPPETDKYDKKPKTRIRNSKFTQTKTKK